jgi:hypothetical protein
MQHGIFQSLTLLDTSGRLLVAAILAALAGSILVNLFVSSYYASLRRDLARNGSFERTLRHDLLSNIFQEAREARRRQGREANLQAIIEHHFQSGLKLSLVGERFVRSATGLVIIIGLLGTFYGLTLSIGKLVSLVAGDSTEAVDLTLALTRGLTESLAGMAVAFSVSLSGVGAAIVLTLVGVFSNLTDRRNAVMIEVEASLERALGASGDAARGAEGSGHALADRLEPIIADFAESVRSLHVAMEHFDSGLTNFANTTRDFREFNLHLKDNVQRMSLSFADFSEAIKSELEAMKTWERG